MQPGKYIPCLSKRGKKQHFIFCSTYLLGNTSSLVPGPKVNLIKLLFTVVQSFAKTHHPLKGAFPVYSHVVGAFSIPTMYLLGNTSSLVPDPKVSLTLLQSTAVMYFTKTHGISSYSGLLFEQPSSPNPANSQNIHPSPPRLLLVPPIFPPGHSRFYLWTQWELLPGKNLSQPSEYVELTRVRRLVQPGLHCLLSLARALQGLGHRFF